MCAAKVNLSDKFTTTLDNIKRDYPNDLLDWINRNIEVDENYKISWSEV